MKSWSDEGHIVITKFSNNGEKECLQFCIIGLQSSSLNISFIQSSKIVPHVFSELAVSFNTFCGSILLVPSIISWVLANELLNGLEVLNIGNEVIVIFIHLIEDIFSNFVRDSHMQECICFIDQGEKLLKCQFSFSSMGNLSSSVTSLETHLTAVPFEQKISLCKIIELQAQSMKPNRYCRHQVWSDFLGHNPSQIEFVP